MDDDSRIKDIIYKRRNDYDIVNDPESIASCKKEQNRDVIDNTRLGSYDKYGNYVIIPEIKRELIDMPKLVYNQYGSNGIKVYELKSTIPIFNDVYLKLVISGDMANLMICEQVNREAGGYLEVYDEVIDSTAMGLEERLPLSIVFRNYNIFENPDDFGKELKDSKFYNILTRKVYLGLLSKELKSVSTLDEKEAFKNMVSTLKQSGEYGKKVLDEFLSRLKDRPAIFEISKAENYNKAMNEVLLSSLEIATTEQDKQDFETRQTYLSVLNARDENIEEGLQRANDRVSEEYVKHIVDKAKSDFVNEQETGEELTASDEFYAKLNSGNVRTHHRTLDKPILKQGKEGSQEITATTKEERIKQILAQKEKSAKKTPAGKKLKASKGKKTVKKLKAGSKKKKTASKAKKRVKPKKAKVKTKKKVKKAKPKKKTAKKKSAKKKVKRKLAKRKLKAKKGKVKSKKKKVKKPKNAKKAKKKANSLKPKKQGASQKFKASAPKKSAKKKAVVNLALKTNLYEREMDIYSRATLSYAVNVPKGVAKQEGVAKQAPTQAPQKEEELVITNLNTRIKDSSTVEPVKRESKPQNTTDVVEHENEQPQDAILNIRKMVASDLDRGAKTAQRTLGVTSSQSSNTQGVASGTGGPTMQSQAGKNGFSHSSTPHASSSAFSQIKNGVLGQDAQHVTSAGKEPVGEILEGIMGGKGTSSKTQSTVGKEETIVPPTPPIEESLEEDIAIEEVAEEEVAEEVDETIVHQETEELQPDLEKSLTEETLQPEPAPTIDPILNQ